MSSIHRIMIVDDEPLNVKLLAAKLSAEKYETIQAYSGAEALGKITARFYIKSPYERENAK